MKRIARAVFTVLILAFTFSAWGAVPPPPVNQFIGIPDTLFGQMETADCRNCHSPTPPPNIPVDPTSLVDRHHLLVQQAVIPDGTAAPGGVPGQLYQCQSCHVLRFNPTTRFFEFTQNHRDCLACHRAITDPQGNVVGTVHHATPRAQGGDCVGCHGNIVNNMNDGHRIPTYAPSLVTPHPSVNPTTGRHGAGTCTYCHRGSPAGAPSVDPASGILVHNNGTLHHLTGFGAPGGNCLWCHDITTGTVPIRRCQGCHGLDTLHSIQYDNTGQGIVPGAMDPGYGHIGSQQDCWGCHGFGFSQTLSAAPTEAIVPTISTISATSVPAGEETLLTLFGNSLVNDAATATLESVVEVVDGLGNRITLQPLSVAPSSMELVLPAYLNPGTYRMTVVKDAKVSNPVVISVIPVARVASADCADGRVVVTGSGFGPYLDVQGAGMGLLAGGEFARIVSWSETRIEAELPTCLDVLEVKTLFGSAVVRTAAEPAPESAPENVAPPAAAGNKGKRSGTLKK